MATKAYIGIVNKNKLKYVYLHYNGYPKSTGKILKKYYKKRNPVNDLIDSGNILILKNSIKTSKFFKDKKGEEWEDIKPVEVLYNLEKLLKKAKINIIKYVYIFNFREQEWEGYDVFENVKLKDISELNMESESSFKKLKHIVTELENHEEFILASKIKTIRRKLHA